MHNRVRVLHRYWLESVVSRSRHPEIDQRNRDETMRRPGGTTAIPRRTGDQLFLATLLFSSRIGFDSAALSLLAFWVQAAYAAIELEQ